MTGRTAAERDKAEPATPGVATRTGEELTQHTGPSGDIRADRFVTSDEAHIQS